MHGYAQKKVFHFYIHIFVVKKVLHNALNGFGFVDSDFHFGIFVYFGCYGRTKIFEAVGELDILVIW
jgi:hypothetical protein